MTVWSGGCSGVLNAPLFGTTPLRRPSQELGRLALEGDGQLGGDFQADEAPGLSRSGERGSGSSQPSSTSVSSYGEVSLKVRETSFRDCQFLRYQPATSGESIKVTFSAFRRSADAV